MQQTSRTFSSHKTETLYLWNSSPFPSFSIMPPFNSLSSIYWAPGLGQALRWVFENGQGREGSSPYMACVSVGREGVSTWDSAKKMKLNSIDSEMDLFSHFNISEIGVIFIIDHYCPGFFQRIYFCFCYHLGTFLIWDILKLNSLFRVPTPSTLTAWIQTANFHD